MLILCIQKNRVLCGCITLMQKSYQVFRRIGCLCSWALSVAGSQNTSPASVPQHVPLSHPLTFPGIPQAGSASQLQPEFSLTLAQHSLYVYLLMTQPVFYSLGKSACHLWQKNNLEVGKREVEMCVCKSKHVKSL